MTTIDSQSETLSSPSRVVHCADAVTWLTQHSVFERASLVVSLPDISEFPGLSVHEWTQWFISVASLVVRRTPESGVSVFFQSDIKVDGRWIDKGYLCQKAAEECGSSLLWHKIACRFAPGAMSCGRPGYSHILCFSKGVRAPTDRATMDVITNCGEKTWTRGMGLEVSLLIAQWIAEFTSSLTIVNPFCGQGAMLAAGNSVGLNVIGVDRSPKRVEYAQKLSIDLRRKVWVKPSRVSL